MVANQLYDFYSYGESNVDFGLVVGYATNGYGLVTRGLVWQASEIWGPAVGYSSLTTSWAAPSGYSALATSWAAPSGYSALTTGWTLSRLGVFGEIPPRI